MGVSDALQTHGHFSKDKPRRFHRRLAHPTVWRETLHQSPGSTSKFYPDEVRGDVKTVDTIVPCLQSSTQLDGYRQSRAQIKAPLSHDIQARFIGVAVACLREIIKQITNPIVAPQMSIKTSLDAAVRDGIN